LRQFFIRVMKIQTLWSITPYRLVNIYRR